MTTRKPPKDCQKGRHRAQYGAWYRVGEAISRDSKCRRCRRVVYTESWRIQSWEQTFGKFTSKKARQAIQLELDL